ncbi:MAG TPA: ABC transporter ATP-binding protein [Acidimicrobiales bacterium]|nr:ABC transporter ATP-binding protein [Acidimicrobiales bacterium]
MTGAGPQEVISATRAAVALGGRRVWRDLDMQVDAGEFVAVLGPNGAGKSTLVKAVLGLLPLAAGTLTVLGDRPGRHNDAIGYLPQRRSFDAGLRVRGRDMVQLGLDGDRWGVPLPGRTGRRRRSEIRVQQTIELVGAGPFADRPVGEVSGGEQQRLLIAQALVRQPRLLILDEPLDSLDLPNQAAVAALVAKVCGEGVTVVMVAHDVNPILPYLDRVVYLGRGSAVSGAPAEVITSSTLTDLFSTPIEVLHASDGRLVVVGQPEPPAYHADRHTHS